MQEFNWIRNIWGRVDRAWKKASLFCTIKFLQSLIHSSKDGDVISIKNLTQRVALDESLVLLADDTDEEFLCVQTDSNLKATRKGRFGACGLLFRW